MLSLALAAEMLSWAVVDGGAPTGAVLAAVAVLLILWRKARLRAHQARHFAREP